MGLFNIIKDVYGNTDDFKVFNCPTCGAQMKYTDSFKDILRCPDCGYEIDTDSMILDKDPELAYYFETSETEHIPEGCAACGGPYPSCKSYCSLFDE